MKERDYIAATNLARINMLIDILVHLNPTAAVKRGELSDVKRIVSGWQDATHRDIDDTKVKR